MMLLVVFLIAAIYIFSGFGRLEDKRFLFGSLLMIFYIFLYYIFPVTTSGTSIYIGRLTQYLPVFSYGVILFGHSTLPSNKEKYVHWAGFLGLVFSILSHSTI
ncbi:hypothetical protein [Aeromonas cavernicola]|uniref:Uncharacterized protein n=1 Tax=Aeromonas cavernicola TaxID=1006623 RepID=A0A2H9U8Z4_9GAMM|nr:hypothetical protein [Aeromonas cavernicola]PJG60493.1 hypothetical protein CUC53_01665 [Aeromonas cavernicola]